MACQVDTEWGELKRVVVGHGRDMGTPASEKTAFDPTSYYHLKQGNYPSHAQVELQLDGLASVLTKHGVEVVRPIDQPELEQVFARDVGMVIEDRFFRSAMIEDRADEWAGISPLLEGQPVYNLPANVRMEGGDVLLLGDTIAVGVTRQPELVSLKTARTNAGALDFLSDTFPDKQVIGLELHKHDRNPLRCALHLDCAFRPLGQGEAIVCQDAFLDAQQLNGLLSRFSHTLNISLQEAALLHSNLLHLDPETLLIDPRFNRISDALRSRGYRLIEVPMHHVGKMGGLFRCTTLPLLRH